MPCTYNPGIHLEDKGNMINYLEITPFSWRTLTTKKQPTSVKTTTVANWIKTAMDKAGIDTNHYQAHSIRAASSTKAVELGHSVLRVKDHAGWSLNSNTCEKHCYKPFSQASSSTANAKSIFSLPLEAYHIRSRTGVN